MVQYRISGQKSPNDLRIHAIPLGPGRRARLGVHWVTGVWTPMMSGGRPLPPGEYTVEFRNPETGLSGTLAYRAQAGRRVLHEIRRIRKDGIGPVDPQDLRSISFTSSTFACCSANRPTRPMNRSSIVHQSGPPCVSFP